VNADRRRNRFPLASTLQALQPVEEPIEISFGGRVSAEDSFQIPGLWDCVEVIRNSPTSSIGTFQFALKMTYQKVCGLQKLFAIERSPRLLCRWLWRSDQVVRGRWSDYRFYRVPQLIKTLVGKYLVGELVRDVSDCFDLVLSTLQLPETSLILGARLLLSTRNIELGGNHGCIFTPPRSVEFPPTSGNEVNR
jgi:hypothetical protein